MAVLQLCQAMFQKNTNVGGGGSGSYGGLHGLSSNSYKKNATVGGFRSSRGHVGSKSMGSAGGSGDVIGSVVGISDIIPVMSAAGKKIRRTIVLEDVDGNRLDLTFWDTWASMWDPYANKRDAIEHLVMILQLGKVKYWDGRVQERDGYEANKVKIELFSPEVKVVSIAEFFHGAINRMVDGIRDSEPDSYCIVYARIYRIHKEHGWAYTACKSCNKKVDILPRQNRPPVYVCEEHGNVQPASRFMVIVRVIDNSGSTPLLFFNNSFVKLSGYTAWELIEKYNMDPYEYWPEELDNIVGKKCLFKLFYSEYNVAKNNHTYRCDSFFEDVELINHFKNNFIDTETDDEELSDELAQSTTKKNKHIIQDSSDEHDSDMHIASKTMDSTSSVEGSSSKKRKLIIDLDDVESEPEEEGNILKTHELVAVKMEPED
ncbi:replication protein A 70 kDa DNA-binding subunit B [Tanacetum coccineum]|uniref:Replication protein A 70 kDa DNA-binding subunit B n=1 Tax=Tanacetum coccineum TaxID=301880 RepID=A0ABQ5AWF5_9ASTR